MAEPKMGNCVKFIPAGEEHYRCNCGLDRSGCGACGAGWGAKHHRMIQSGEAIVGDDGLLLVKPSVPTKMVSMDGAWCMSELGSDLQRLLAPGSDAGMLAQTTTEGLASSKDENTPLDLVLDWIARKPLDASDVGGALSLADARAEIKFIREFAAEFLRSAGVEDEGAEDIETDEHEPADQAVRGALYDKQDLSSFRKVTYEKSNEVRKLIYDIIIKLNVLFEHDTGEALQIIDAFKPLAFKRGETIIEQGDAWSEFFVVERGGLSANVTTKMLSRVKVGEYSEGSSFGESALIFGSPSASTITATTDCKLWSIDRTTYRSIIGKLRIDQYEEKSRFIRECVVGGKKFAGTFDDSQIEDLTIATKVDCYQKGDVILREGELGDTFYIVASGLVERCRSDRRDVAVIERKKTFGTTSLLKGVSSPFTYKAKTPVTVYYLTKSDFELIMGSLRDALDGNSVANSRMMARSQSIKTSMSTDRKYNLELKDLGFFNMLGRGAFGQVRLVQEKKLRKVFALKAQSKHSIVMKGNEERVLNEYHMMKEMDHPFIAGMHCAMQDRHHLYFLMDLLPGGELMPYLVRKIKQGRGFEEDITKFYAASVVLVYEKIHSLSIAYRDLKPENIVLNKKGYGILVDFGLAKEIDKGQAYTLCGTPDYMAPEIIRGTGHDWAVDYWCLGVFLFEMTNGTAPFYAKDKDHRTRNILDGYEFVRVPSHFSGGLRDLISNLLIDNPSKRLGRTLNGVQGIKNHRWFAGFDWECFGDQTMMAPIQPTIPPDIKTIGKKKAGDSFFHDAQHAPASDWWPNLKGRDT